MTDAREDRKRDEVLADEALEHARYLAGLAQRINDHDPALSHDDEAQAADSDLSSIAVWLKARAQEWLAAPTTNAPEISTSLVDAAAPDAELDRWLNLFVAYGNMSESVEPGSLQKYQDMRAAIHAHVEKVTREARAEGRLRDMDVPTLHKRPKPEALVQKCGACGHGRVTHSGRTGQCVGIVAPDRLPCSCREFVAPASTATGEVVCTAYLRHMKDRIIELRGAVLTKRDWFTDPDGVPVDLVLRRDKEGV